MSRCAELISELVLKIRTRQDVLNLIPQLYREKARFQGTVSLEKLLDVATATGQKYGLQNMSSIAVLMGMMFFLGAGVDKDPLFPWVGSLLQSEQSEDEKIRAILTMARKRARSEYIIQRRMTGIERYENLYMFVNFLSTASCAELNTMPFELNTRYFLKKDDAAQECMEQAIARFSENKTPNCCTLYAVALFFCRIYPSPAIIELENIVADNTNVQETNIRLVQWMRCNAENVANFLFNSILKLED